MDPIDGAATATPERHVPAWFSSVPPGSAAHAPSRTGQYLRCTSRLGGQFVPLDRATCHDPLAGACRQTCTAGGRWQDFLLEVHAAGARFTSAKAKVRSEVKPGKEGHASRQMLPASMEHKVQATSKDLDRLD